MYRLKYEKVLNISIKINEYLNKREEESLIKAKYTLFTVVQ